MMKTKKIFTAVLSILFAVCLSFAVLPFASAKADDAALPEVTMKHGASIRLSTTGTDGSDSGIKFAFSMSAEDYAALSASDVYTDVKYGVFIAAASYNVTGKEIADETHLVGDNAIYYWQVGETDGEPVYNVTPAAGMKRIICAEGDAMATETDGKAYFYGSVVNMKDENLRRDYIGVGYVKYTVNGETHYKFAAADDNVRSVETVARVAYTADPELRDKLVSLYLNKVARDCVVTTAPVAVADLVENGEAQALVTAGEADAYSEMRYSLDNETFSTGIPTAETAGEYTVYYKAASITTFDRDSEVKSVTVTVAEQDTGVLTLKAATVTEIKDDNKALIGFGGTYDFKGLGEYNVGDVLEFRFKGQNIPNVGLFVNKNGVNPIGGGAENTGIFLQTSGHGTATFDKRLYITGPFLVDAGGVEYYQTLSGRESYAYKTELGKNIELGVDVSNGDGTSPFGIAMLDEETDYVYRVTTSSGSATGKVAIKYTLYTVADGAKTLVKEVTREITHYLTSLENRYAVVYGAGDYSKKNITFEYEVNPVDLTGELTLQPAQITESKVDGKTYFSGTYDYKGLGAYALGDTLEFGFTGKNIPNVGIFVNKNGVNPVGGGTENTGLFLQTSGYGSSSFNQRLYVVGPFLLDAGSSEPYEGIISNYAWKNELGKNAELGVKTNSFGIALLDDNTDYVYTITTAASATAGRVVINAKLFSVADGVQTEVYSYDFDRPCYMTDFENKYAVAYGAGTLYGKAITFSYEVKKAA